MPHPNTSDPQGAAVLKKKKPIFLVHFFVCTDHMVEKIKLEPERPLLLLLLSRFSRV